MEKGPYFFIFFLIVKPKWKLYFLCMLHGCEIMIYSLFLSFFVFLLCCDVHPLWFWDCALLFAPPPRHSTLLLSSLSLLSVVYQDGFYGAADLYVSTLISGPTHLPLPPSPLHSFLLLSPLRVILHVASSHALHRVACIKVNEPTVYKHKARLVKKLALPLFFFW